MAMKRRTDNKGRILRVGESQRKDEISISVYVFRRQKAMHL